MIKHGSGETTKSTKEQEYLLLMEVYEQQENGRLTSPPYNPIMGKKLDSDIYLINCQIGNVLTMFRHRGLFPIRQ